MGRSDSSVPLDPALLAREEPVRRLPGRNLTKADILVYRLEGEEVAVKDYARRPSWIRHTIGRWLVRREVRAHRVAAGLEGLPRFLGRVGPFALALEFVDAVPIAERPGAALDDALFDRLEAIVASIHGRGVALGDLHQRDVLIAADGTLHIVDLATSWISPEGARGWRRAIFRRLADLDRIAVARMRARWTGGDPDEAAASVGSTMVKWHARGRRLKRWWDRARGRGPSRPEEETR